jgi:hypothetical protein
MKSTHHLVGQKHIEVRVAHSHSASVSHSASSAQSSQLAPKSPLADDTFLIEWCAVACLIEHGRRPFEVMATGVSTNIPDEEVAIRLALLNLSEKVSWEDQTLVAQALVRPMDIVVSRLFSLREIFSRKPREVSEVVALLRGNLPTDEPI